MTKPIISVQNVSKKFIIPHEKENSLKGTVLGFYKKKRDEEFYALKDVSFDIYPGEFIGIIGRNGSGKSTLLKILAGIYAPDSGKVIVNGAVSPFLELGVGFNGELSGRDNVFLYGAVLGLSEEEIKRKFSEIVAFAELEKFIDMKMKNYSSGMYVRLAFSVAIQANAPILLVDEVLAVGDANFQQKCFSVFERYKKEKKTVVLVTHDLSAVEKWCDRAIVIDKHKLNYVGKPSIAVKQYSQIVNIPTALVKSIILTQDKIIKENELLKNEIAKTKKETELKEKQFEVDSKVNLITKINNEHKVAMPNLSYFVTDIILKKRMINDEPGDKKVIIDSNSNIKLFISFQIPNKIKELEVGISIKDKNGVIVCSWTTYWDSFQFSRKIDSIKLILKKVKLNFGEYYFSCSLFSVKDKKIYYYNDQLAEFKIINSKKCNGLLVQEHGWEQ